MIYFILKRIHVISVQMWFYSNKNSCSCAFFFRLIRDSFNLWVCLHKLKKKYWFLNLNSNLRASISANIWFVIQFELIFRLDNGFRKCKLRVTVDTLYSSQKCHDSVEILGKTSLLIRHSRLIIYGMLIKDWFLVFWKRTWLCNKRVPSWFLKFLERDIYTKEVFWNMWVYLEKQGLAFRF